MADKITRCKIRMYRMGTGDCFILKFFAGRSRKFTMMIDGGVCNGSQDYLQYFADQIIEYTDKQIDVLAITHEHKDHVYLFEACQETMDQLEIGELWLAWTEEDENNEVKEWKKDHGKQKLALAKAASALKNYFKGEASEFKNEIKMEMYQEEIFSARNAFSDTLLALSELHVHHALDGTYSGEMEGLRFMKEKMVGKTKYFRQGDIQKELNNLTGINIYFLGPPNLYDDVKKTTSRKGEVYQSNSELQKEGLFSVAMTRDEHDKVLTNDLFPFERKYFNDLNEKKKNRKKNMPITINDFEFSNEIHYQEAENNWRKIDYDWMMNAGSLALRLQRHTNNLSLVMAIEFEESKKVMLFPGDAEYGSWQTWHDIDWDNSVKVINVDENEPNKHFTKDLLERTIFYKVAHHLSSNGTPKRLGIDMMNNSDLVAMATLDYDRIGPRWDSTMPNRSLTDELLKKTRGRLIILNDANLFYDFSGNVALSKKIDDYQKKLTNKEKEQFEADFDPQRNPPTITYSTSDGNVTEEKVLYYEYTVDGRK